MSLGLHPGSCCDSLHYSPNPKRHRAGDTPYTPSYLYYLLPDAEMESHNSRLRSYKQFPRVYTRRKRYCSFIQYALSHYQDRVKNNWLQLPFSPFVPCSLLLVVSCTVTVASLGLVPPGAATDGVTLFFPEKTDNLFFVTALCKVMTFLSCRLVTTPTFSVLSKFSHKNFLFHSGVTPWIVSPVAVHPCPLLVMPLHCESLFVLHDVYFVFCYSRWLIADLVELFCIFSSLALGTANMSQ